MNYTCVLFLSLMFLVTSCSTEPAKESTQANHKVDAVVSISTQNKVLDYRQRCVQFRIMPDKTIEEQVTKYETFAALFIEYQDIDRNHNLYTVEEQENNRQGYLILKDELNALKNKLRKSISTINTEQEQRLNEADAKMNRNLPNVYKEDTTQAN